jgi:Fe-S-cluster containining protein
LKGENPEPSQVLTRESSIRFQCRPSLPCFTKCCRDVTIFLGPYDVVRLRRRLGMTSGEFLRHYTITLLPEASGFPLLILRMDEKRDKKCPFVGPGGCTVYEDRPWSCRMFPLDKGEREGQYLFVASKDLCLGEDGAEEISVADYLLSQGVPHYEEVEERLRALGPEPGMLREPIRNPRLQHMCRMAMYDVDTFRRLVMESRFLEIFYVERDLLERIPTDDVAVLELGQRWLRFGLQEGESLRLREGILGRDAAEGRK